MVSLPGPAQPHSAEFPTEIIIGGCDEEMTVLDPSEYEIRDNVLYRRHGKPWPFQDLGRPLGECGTWAITYWRGLRPPKFAAQMVGTLTLEFLRASVGDQKCRLPKSVTRLQRQGVSYELDPLSLYAAGKTGIPEVDSWLASVNPNHIMQAPSVI